MKLRFGLTVNGQVITTALQEWGISNKTMLTWSTDSNSAKSMTNRLGMTRRTKHIDIKFLYIRELTMTGKVKINEVLTTHNPADVLTKNVGKEILNKFEAQLGVHEGTQLGTIGTCTMYNEDRVGEQGVQAYGAAQVELKSVNCSNLYHFAQKVKLPINIIILIIFYLAGRIWDW